MTVSAALSGANLTALRAGNDSVKRYLAYVPQVSIATARINQASFPNPNGGFLVDNTSANWDDITKGMTVWIGTTEGGREIGVYRLREDSDPTTLLLGEVSLGDPGMLALSTLDQLEDNAYVTVWQDRNIWSVFPSIEYSGGVDARSGTFLKDHDEAYSTQNETVPAFALNIGAHRAGNIDSGNIVTFDFTADVYTFVVATVSSYLWDVGDGTITVGSNSTESITATFPAGYREISCTITLSTGAVRTVYRSVWARDPDSVANHLDIQVLSDTRDMLGRVMRFRAYDPLGALAVGQMALYWEDASWNGSDVASATKQCVGWLRSVNGVRDPDSSIQEFELVSAMHILADLKAFAQHFTVAADPDNWQEVIAGLSHIDYWIFYLLNYHTSLLDFVDYEISLLTTLLAKAWDVGSGSWASALNQAGARVNCSVGQRSDGTIFVRRNPQVMSQTDRDAVIERMTLTEADLGAIPLNRTLRPRIGKLKASAFAYDGSTLTPYLAVAPGNVSGQGASEAALDDQLITAAGGQSELNERAANEWARLNNPLGNINAPLPLNYDVFEPCEQYWVRLTVGASYSPDGSAFNRRMLVRSVTVNHEQSAKSIVLELEAETSGIGAPATTIPVGLPSLSDNAGVVDSNSYWPDFTYDALTGLPVLAYDPWQVPNLASPPQSQPPAEETILGLLLGWGTDLHLSETWGAALPTWTLNHDVSSPEAVQSFVIDALQSDPAVAVLGWLLTYDNTDSKLKYNADITDAGSWATKQTLSSARYNLVRAVYGVADGVAAFGYVDNPTDPWTYVFDFASENDGGWEASSAFYAGVSYSSGAWHSVESLGSEVLGIIVNFPQAATITSVRVVYTAAQIADGGTREIATNIGTYGALETSSGSHDTTVTSTVGSVTSVAAVVDNSGNTTGENTITRVEISGTGVNPFLARQHKVVYSSDTGDTIDMLTVGISNQETGYDVDDYGLGVHLAPANYGIWYTAAYDGAFAELSGLTGTSIHKAKITCIRIPFKKILTQAANNSATSLQFIYGVNVAVSGATLWAVTFDSSDGSIIAQVDITPIVSGTTYTIINANALSTAGANTQVIAALGKPNGGGNTDLLLTSDGGATWVVAQSNVAYTALEFLAGSQQILFLAGQAYSANRGVTIINQTGDVAETLIGLTGLAV